MRGDYLLEWMLQEGQTRFLKVVQQHAASAASQKGEKKKIIIKKNAVN